MTDKKGLENAEKLRQMMSSAPPTNRGVENTQGVPTKTPMRALVDWVSVTFKSERKISNLVSVLGMNFDDFHEQKNGNGFYRKSVRFGSIVIFYDSADGEGGVHLNMSGKACREYEFLSPYKESPLGVWPHLFSLFAMMDGKYTRLDLAVDTFNKEMMTTTVWRYLQKKNVTSQFRKVRRMTAHQIKDFESQGDTIYFGSGSSNIQIRIYDKKAEREAKSKDGKEIEVTVDNWVRTEVQLRDEHACMAVLHMLSGRPVGNLVKGIMKNYVQFRKKTGDSNLSRRPLASWYLKYLNDVEQLSLTPIAQDYTVERVKDWVDKTVSPSIAMLLTAMDITDPHELIREVLSSSTGRINNKKIDAVNTYRISQGKDPMTLNEMQQHLSKLANLT